MLSIQQISGVWNVSEFMETSYIIPLFKSGSLHDVNNYRGIAKINCIPKLFESLLVDELFHNVKSQLTNYQHGFYKGRSITSNLMELSTHVSGAFNNRNQVDVGYFDFSKAFDQINHDHLVKKTSAIWFSSVTVYVDF